MSITETIDLIEAELDADRQALLSALTDLRGSMTMRGFVAQAMETASTHPVPVATAAAGLGVMAFRKLKADDDPKPAPPSAELPAWMAKADTLRARAGGMLAQIDLALQDGRIPRSELLARREEVLAALTVDVRAALGSGLDGLSGADRARAMAQREVDYAAHLGVADAGDDAGADGGNPLAIAAAVAAVGAAVALLMPRTELEDRLIGDARTRLLNDARRLVQAEAHRFGDLGQLVMAVLSKSR